LKLVLEQLSDSAGKTQDAAKSGAECGELFRSFDPPLREAGHARMALSVEEEHGVDGAAVIVPPFDSAQCVWLFGMPLTRIALQQLLCVR
jgi:hypothetical protein